MSRRKQLLTPLEESTIEELDRIAEAQDRNRNWIINEAIENYLELHKWRVEHVKQGITDSEAGRTLSHEKVKGRIAQLHSKRKAKAK